jgi:hypothetical protein
MDGVKASCLIYSIPPSSEVGERRIGVYPRNKASAISGFTGVLTESLPSPMAILRHSLAAQGLALALLLSKKIQIQRSKPSWSPDIILFFLYKMLYFFTLLIINIPKIF